MKYSFKKNSLLAILSLCLLAWGFFSGKDINWDFLNYHLYSAYLMLGDRWEKDYFAASIQSYLNPISYLPLYYMVISDIPDVFVELWLITPGVVSIFLFWKLSEKLIPNPEENIVIIFLMVALALTSSLWLIVVGSTFNDSLSCAITLGALLFLINGTKGKWNFLFYAGVLSGLSVGIKLTNGIYVPLIFVIFIYLWRREGFIFNLNGVIIIALGVALGFIISHGYWSWKLWHEFGNPFFPFFNSLFNSPDFLPENLQDRRFMGDYWGGVFKLPFEMAMLQSWIYSEASAPEIKLAVMFIVLPVAAVFLIRNHKKILNEEKLIAVTIFLIMGYILWVFSSRIGRYAIVLWMISGILIPAWIYLFFNKSIARIFGLFILVMQCFLNVTAGISHWSPAAWGGGWFKPDVPQFMLEKPHTIITSSLQTFSAIAPFTHPESRWSSLMGQYILPSGNRISEKLKKNLEINEVIALIPSKNGGDKYFGPNEEEKKIIDDLFLNYGFNSKKFECEPVRINYIAMTPWNGGGIKNSIVLHACRMKKANYKDIVERQNLIEQYDQIFNSIEDLCRKQLSPRRSNSLSIDGEFSRFYFNSSLHMYTEDEKLIAKFPQQLSHQVIAIIDRDEHKIKSEVVCPKFPQKLYLN